MKIDAITNLKAKNSFLNEIIIKITHTFIKNPMKGGIPAIDRKTKKIKSLSICLIWIVLKESFLEKLFDREKVIKKASKILYNISKISQIFLKIIIEPKIQDEVKIVEKIINFLTLDCCEDLTTHTKSLKIIKMSKKLI